MANCKNSVSLIGFVGNDVEIRQTDKGVKYARINLATSTGGYKKKDGTDVPEVTQWHTCVAWGITAEYAGKYIKKGAKISIDGMLIYGKYTDNQGIERISAKISVQEICLFAMPQQQAQSPPQQQAAYPPNGGYPQQVAPPQQGYPQQAPPQAANGYPQAGYPTQQQPQQQQQSAPFPPPANDDLPF